MIVIADRYFVLPWGPNPTSSIPNSQLESALYIALFRKSIARSEGKVLGLSALILRATVTAGGGRALGGFGGMSWRFASCCLESGALPI